MSTSLSIKYTALNVLLIIIIVGVFSIVFVDQQKKSYEQELILEAENYLIILEGSVAQQILTYDFKSIRGSIIYVRQNPLIDYVYVMNNDEEIIADGLEFESKIYQIPRDKFQKLAFETDAITVQENADLFDISTPIKYGEEKLGVIRIGYSKRELQRNVRDFENTAITLGLIFIFVGSIITYLIILRISKPIKKINQLTHQITLGNFNKKLSFTADDELKTLADSFNEMTEKLSEVRESLILAKEQAEESNELKSEFLAQISHEIRTPINTILNYATLIEEEAGLDDKSSGKYYFNIMRSASQRIIRTIDLILNISEIQKGSYEPKYIKVNIVKEVLELLESDYQLLAQKKGFKFSIEKECNDCEVIVDKYTVTQIFQNLIDNSFLYTSEGFVKIKVLNNKTTLKVIITDSGIGISEDILKKLFEFYKEEEQTYLKKIHGSGLGLMLVENYCEINNAKIKVNSVEGIGTEVEVDFPIYSYK